MQIILKTHIAKVQLKDRQNQIVISYKEIPSGTYIISLIDESHLIASRRITVIR